MSVQVALDIDWSNVSEEDRLAELRRLFAGAVDEFVRQEHLRSLASDMLALLIEVLPYIETAEEDEGYKPGEVAKVTAKIRAIIAKAEQGSEKPNQVRGEFVASPAQERLVLPANAPAGSASDEIPSVLSKAEGR